MLELLTWLHNYGTQRTRQWRCRSLVVLRSRAAGAERWASEQQAQG